MAQKAVLSDASPLIGLAAAGGFELLRRLFGTLAVTATVRREVGAGRGMPGAGELSAAIRARWIRVIRDPAIDERVADLDAGEAATLSAALARPGRCLVLLDDPVARRAANELGIAVTGTAGVLLVAKRRGLVSALRPFFVTLAATSDFRLSADLVRAVLGEAGED